MATTAINAVQLSRLHTKKASRVEELEKMPIGKVASPAAIGYLCYRHGRGLLTIAFFATNLYWIVRFYHQ